MKIEAKIPELIEHCLRTGIALGYARAHKYNDAPSESELTEEIVNCIDSEMREWFTFDSTRRLVSRELAGLENDELWELLDRREIADYELTINQRIFLHAQPEDQIIRVFYDKSLNGRHCSSMQFWRKVNPALRS